MEYQEHQESFERLLNRMNLALEATFAGDLPPRRDLASGHIFGLPRSGTTVLFQLLARSRTVGYPSNVMAFFWRAPAVGAALQRKLASGDATLSLESLGGRTPEPLDPHEFGYFWRHALGHTENSLSSDRAPLPTADLQGLLDGVNSAFDAPTVYKNFLVPRHSQFLTQDLQRQRMVLVRRDPIQVACSLLLLRRRLGLGPDAWLGTKPRDAKPSYSNDVELVSHQVRSLQLAIRDTELEGASACLVVDYRDLCHSPRQQVEQVCKHLGAPPPRSSSSRFPGRLDVSTPSDQLSHDDLSQVRDYLSDVDQ